ncbi:hypothetical protein QL285_092573 [Trifolium repens]|jgi:hypothetical protein|nr:hypothetical protein QL285_092573 [Trifolium repens]
MVKLVFNRRNYFSVSRSTIQLWKTFEQQFLGGLSPSLDLSLDLNNPAMTQPSTCNLQGLKTTTLVRFAYQRDEDQQRTVQSPTFSSLDESYDAI